MIRAIIFDFDGVILESAGIKTDAFRELFSDNPSRVGEIIKYHLNNEGISRYVKFRYIYNNILEKELPGEKEIELGERLSQICFGKVVRAPFVAGTREFLEQNKDRYQFFVASGTPEPELHKIVSERGLKRYFKAVYGSPKTKPDIIEEIMDKYKFIADEIVSVGDAESDRIAAEEAGIIFIKRDIAKDKKNVGHIREIKDLSRLGGILREIENLFNNPKSIQRANS